MLKKIGVHFEIVDAMADVSKYEVLVVGKAALTVDGVAPDITAVRDGLRVVLFEQTPDVLEKRLGFRIAEYGLRNVFKRVPDHPALAGLGAEELRDWRGESTINTPRLKYDRNPADNYGFVFSWSGILEPRIYRCGNRGNVASVLIEKPARGDFLPIVDGGFSLQYSPLMEYREGKGVVVFCQLDVTGRTENDPASALLATNIIEYVSGWKPLPRLQPVYAGNSAGMKFLASSGLAIGACTGEGLTVGQVLIAGPGAGPVLAAHKDAIRAFLKSGGQLLGLGLSGADAADLLPFAVTVKDGEHINAYFEPPGIGSPLAGVSPADVHNRAPRNLPLVAAGAEVVGDGVLALAKDARVVFCQMTPWQFDYSKNYGLKKTFRRASSLVARLLGNMGVSAPTPLLNHFKSSPVSEKRWLDGFYLDAPEEFDDPYRAWRW